MSRILTFTYGTVAYGLFLGAILYAIGFVTGIHVPKTVDSGPAPGLIEALVVNLLLLTLFAVQHSGMARQPFKQWLMRFLSPALERSTFVLLSSLVLCLLFWQWRPMPTVVWDAQVPILGTALLAISLSGWGLVFASTFMINHFELFGLHQVVNYLRRRDMPRTQFKTPGLYRVVRHPIYLGFIIAFWITPLMTLGHLLFASVTTGYILLGIMLEERDLTALFGDEYRQYRRRVAMLFPSFRRQAGSSKDADSVAALTVPPLIKS